MEQDRNFADNNIVPNTYCNMEQGKCFNSQMPPYMYGNCFKEDMNMYYGNMMNNCNNMNWNRNMYTNPYQMPKVEPLENMCGKTYKILIVHVRKTVQKIMVDNMGMIPQSISKDKFNKYMNDIICEVIKEEKEIKKIVVIDRSEVEEEENIDRAFCPYCNGMLKDILSVLLVSELLKGGCTTCY